MCRLIFIEIIISRLRCSTNVFLRFLTKQLQYCPKSRMRTDNRVAGNCDKHQEMSVLKARLGILVICSGIFKYFYNISMP